MGGTLATLHNWNEIYWLRGYRASHSNLKNWSAWIGGYKKDGKWYWKGKIVDTPLTAADWVPQHEPNNSGGHEDCLQLYGLSSTREHDFRWNDLSCSNQLPFICETDQIM